MKKIFTLVMLSILTVMNVNAEETTLWEGDWWFSWEAANTDEAHKGWNANSNGVNFADYNEGDVFYFYLVKDSEHLFDNEYYNYRFDDSNWNALPGCAATDASGNETKAKFVLTADIKTALASADFALHGHGLKLVKVTKGEEEQPVVIEDLPAATLWTGEQEIDGWGVKCMVLNTENEAFTVFTEKLTKACNLYFLVENTTGADFRIAGAWGDWAVTAYPSDGYNHLQTLDADNVVKVALTEEFVKNAFIDKGGVAFWGNGGFKIKAIATTKDSALNPTGINNVATSVKNDNRYYNLNGLVVANPAKGLYIVNGKKVLFK